MPHDRHGVVVRPGDEVLIQFRVKDVSPNEDACNATLEAIDPTDTVGYRPTVACNTRPTVKAMPVRIATTKHDSRTGPDEPR